MCETIYWFVYKAHTILTHTGEAEANSKQRDTRLSSIHTHT